MRSRDHEQRFAKRPILVLLTSHWVSMLGVALVTTAGFSWLFVLPVQLRGHTNNPYIGIVVFIFIPVIFVFGLVFDRLRRVSSAAAYRGTSPISGPSFWSLTMYGKDFSLCRIHFTVKPEPTR